MNNDVDDIFGPVNKSEQELCRRLLDEAEGKPIRWFTQFDGFCDASCDDSDSDADGDSVYIWFYVPELRNSDCVRLQLPSDMAKSDALRVLRKMVRALKRLEKSEQWEGDRKRKAIASETAGKKTPTKPS